MPKSLIDGCIIEQVKVYHNQEVAIKMNGWNIPQKTIKIYPETLDMRGRTRS